MKKQLTTEEKFEEEIADKIRKAIFEYDLKRGCGVSLEKGGFIGERISELENDLSELKKPKENGLKGE